MNKAFERYNKRVEIPISVILETIFSDDNKDVESLSRWALKYGFIDLIKENGDKLGYYKLQDDYTKQSFYILLDKEERRQYDYEDFLCDKLQEKDQQIDNLNNVIKELEELIKNDLDNENGVYYSNITVRDYISFELKKLQELLEQSYIVQVEIENLEKGKKLIKKK